MDSYVLEALKVTLPMMKKILGLDMQVGLFDREKTIGVWYGDTFKMRMEVGEYLDPDKPGHDMILSALNTGIGNSGILPEFVCGVAVDGIVTPVFEEDKVVGVISAAVSLREKKEIEKAAESLNLNLMASNGIVKEITNETIDLASKLDCMKTMTSGMESRIGNSSRIVKQIQKNAYKSNLLALNASIEAARANVINNGFSIVANEMGKLAKESEESTKEISRLLDDTFQEINRMIGEIGQVATISTQQSFAMQDIAEKLKEITLSANQLVEISTVN